ncbi:MAG: Gfo/Idh/MocA family oxidoreductase [Ruminococcaceae bacterium]|nr:Gfo/Idh/MocA family oxidoreductase [Oscillospiraceae bacterium]
MVRIAMLSKWHVHAGGYAYHIKNSDKAEVVAVWDDNTERGQSWAEELGCTFYADLDELLARDDIDAVVCDAPTTAHKDILIKAAKAGKHIFTEKALCPTVEECLEVKKAVLEAGVTFVISFPQRGRPCIQFAKKMIEKGAFGDITFMRVRDAHSGVSDKWLPAYWFEKADAAGGAMMDLGCHPMYLLAYILGKPKRVTGLFTSPYGTPVDENAVAIAEFNGGAIGVAETGFISTGAPQTVEILGTKGAMLARGEDVQFRSDMLEGVFGWYVTPELPGAKPSPLDQFIWAVSEGKGSPEGLGIDDAIALTELLENSYIANDSGKIVDIK